MKTVNLSNYKYKFNPKTGFFARWGKTFGDDPKFSPIGPEIADIEISTICHGPDGRLCEFCYKKNSACGENMSFETFKKVFKKIKRNLTQIAFGIGDINDCPDLFKIFTYCHKNGVIPNVTVNGNITSDQAKKLAKVCGAVAVSNYEEGELCREAATKLIDAGLKQVNIHQLLCEESLSQCLKIITDVALARINKDPFGKVRAIVFLSIKAKGRAEKKGYKPISAKTLHELIQTANRLKVGIGFDSCAAPKVLCAEKNSPNFKMLQTCVEPCESTLFSAYINVKGDFFPCSFVENEKDWKEGVSVVDCKDFLKDVWYNKKVVQFRKKLLSTENKKVKNCFSPCRKCPAFNIY